MSIGLLFWVLFIVSVVLGFVPQAQTNRWPGQIVVWVLLALLGWVVFGGAVHR